MKFVKPRNLLATLLLTLMVSGCGWHLRGAGMIPEGLDTLYVVSNDPDGKLSRDLGRALESAGVEVPASAVDSELTLVILRERSSVRVATVSEQARVSEQELTEQAEFMIVDKNGETVLPLSTVSVERVFEYDESNVLATQDERELIRREMRRDLISQILNRLRQLAPVVTPASTEANETKG